MNTMKWLFAILTLLACSSAYAADATPPKSSITELHVWSFNIRYGTAKDGPNEWKHRKDHLFDLLRDESPDIVGVQEAFGFQLDEIMRNVGGYKYVGRKREGPHGEEHSSILYKPSRFTVDKWNTFWLSDTPDKPSRSWGNRMNRICTWARFVDKQTGQGFYIYNTHIEGRLPEGQLKSVQLMLQHMAARKHRAPFILTGDFNADEKHKAIAYVKGTAREKNDPAPGSSGDIRFIDSFRVINPDAREFRTGNLFRFGMTRGGKIDYVFVQPGIEVIKADINRSSRNRRYPSDHFPVTARLRINGK